MKRTRILKASLSRLRCKAETKSCVEHQNCGGVQYRSAFQGNNLDYVMQSPWLTRRF